MWKIQIAAVVAFGVVLFAGAQLARAQEVERATVPFPFAVGRVTLPAGSYEVVADETDPGLLEIRSADGRFSAFAIVLAEDTTARRGDCQFQFVNVGGRYYLTKIEDGTGDVSDLTLPDAVVRVVHAADRMPASEK